MMMGRHSQQADDDDGAAASSYSSSSRSMGPGGGGGDGPLHSRERYGQHQRWHRFEGGGGSTITGGGGGEYDDDDDEDDDDLCPSVASSRASHASSRSRASHASHASYASRASHASSSRASRGGGGGGGGSARGRYSGHHLPPVPPTPPTAAPPAPQSSLLDLDPSPDKDDDDDDDGEGYNHNGGAGSSVGAGTEAASPLVLDGRHSHPRRHVVHRHRTSVSYARTTISDGGGASDWSSSNAGGSSTTDMVKRIFRAASSGRRRRYPMPSNAAMDDAGVDYDYGSGGGSDLAARAAGGAGGAPASGDCDETAAAFARTAPLAGYLTKLGTTIPTYKRRFFVLKPSAHLYYFVSPNDTVPRGCVDLDACGGGEDGGGCGGGGGGRMEVREVETLGDGRVRFEILLGGGGGEEGDGDGDGDGDDGADGNGADRGDGRCGDDRDCDDGSGGSGHDRRRRRRQRRQQQQGGQRIVLEARDAETARRWMHHLRTSRPSHLRTVLDDCHRTNAELRARVEDLIAKLERTEGEVRAAERERDGAVQDGRETGERLEELDGAVRMLTRVLGRPLPDLDDGRARKKGEVPSDEDDDDDGKDDGAAGADSAQGPPAGTSSSDGGCSKGDDDEDDEERRLSSLLIPRTGFAALFNVSSQLRSQLRQASLEAGLATRDAEDAAAAAASAERRAEETLETLAETVRRVEREGRERAEEAEVRAVEAEERAARIEGLNEELERRLSKAKSEIEGVMEENRKMRELVGQKKRDNKILVREVKSLRSAVEDVRVRAEGEVAEARRKEGEAKARAAAAAEAAAASASLAAKATEGRRRRKWEEERGDSGCSSVGSSGIGTRGDRPDEAAARLIAELEGHVATTLRLHERLLAANNSDNNNNSSSSSVGGEEQAAEAAAGRRVDCVAAPVKSCAAKESSPRKEEEEETSPKADSGVQPGRVAAGIDSIVGDDADVDDAADEDDAADDTDANLDCSNHHFAEEDQLDRPPPSRSPSNVSSSVATVKAGNVPAERLGVSSPDDDRCVSPSSPYPATPAARQADTDAEKGDDDGSPLDESLSPLAPMKLSLLDALSIDEDEESIDYDDDGLLLENVEVENDDDPPENDAGSSCCGSADVPDQPIALNVLDDDNSDEEGADGNAGMKPPHRLSASSASQSQASSSRSTPTVVTETGRATARLTCPLADVTPTTGTATNGAAPGSGRRGGGGSDGGGGGFGGPGQIYHLTFYSKKIGLQFQKVPAIVSARGALTSAMTSDVADDGGTVGDDGSAYGGVSSSSKAELKRVAAIAWRAKSRDCGNGGDGASSSDGRDGETSCRVAMPTDAVLVCGFRGFDDAANRRRPELGARLVAFDGISVEIGMWTFDGVRRSIQSRDRPLTLSFRNDYLTTEQRAILTRAVADVETSLPPPPRPVMQFRDQTRIRTSASWKSDEGGSIRSAGDRGGGPGSVPPSPARSAGSYQSLPSSYQSRRWNTAHGENAEESSVNQSTGYESFSEVGGTSSVLSSTFAPLVAGLVSGLSLGETKERGGGSTFTPQYLRRESNSLETHPHHQEFTASLL